MLSFHRRMWASLYPLRRGSIMEPARAHVQRMYGIAANAHCWASTKSCSHRDKTVVTHHTSAEEVNALELATPHGGVLESPTMACLSSAWWQAQPAHGGVQEQ